MRIMIKVDISNIWGEISLPDLLGLEKEIFDAHNMLTDGSGAGGDYLGWLKLPVREPTDEIIRIRSAAERIRAAPGLPLNCCKAPTTTLAKVGAIPKSLLQAIL